MKNTGLKKAIDFRFLFAYIRPGRGNGKRVASAPLPSGSPELDATR
jgi:hypothetical protein